MNEELKLEAERRDWIGETLEWAQECCESSRLQQQIEDWMLWAKQRLEEPWGGAAA